MSANTSLLLALGVALLFIATPVAAFGAGDIVVLAKINAHNYRHGDIENTLLELLIAAGGNQKFDKLDVKRVYFGNWLRDYSQAIDVGGLKQLPSETIRILLWCLSFLTFGYATGEFEVTADRLGCYRPEEHIDNPKDYADNEDARQYDQRLRGPVNEGVELKVDPETGLKTYIASENAGCETSAALIRRLFEKSIELGRKYNRDHDKKDFYEALRLLGTGLHCMEDYAAHSNYVELALRDLGVDAFPHVGKNTEMDVKGKKIFPLVTGTFGMTDFLHSVVGELGDKVAQSEIEDLESKFDSATSDDNQNDQTSVLKAILDKVPWDMLEGDGSKPDPQQADALKQAANQKAEEAKQHPLDPNATLGGINIEEAKQMSQQTLKDMYPILEFHDQVMQGVTQIISKVPGLDDLLENMSGALQIFIFSLLAPYVKPIIAQARIELKSTSQGVLKSSEKGQYEVFENDNSTDPTHSMLSKDHFSNVLNPVAGQIACATVRFVAPHIVDSWSDEGKDVRQTIDDILQVFHHPALRDENRPGQKVMFETVKSWWENHDDQEHLKQILSTQGVKDGKNHEGEGAEGGGHSHGAPPKRKDDNFIPSAQEGAGFLSGLTGGLLNMGLKETGLDKTFGQPGTKMQQQGSGRNDNESSSNNQGQSYQQSNEQSSYGGGNTHSSSGRQNRNDNEGSSYGSGGNQYGASGLGNEDSTMGSTGSRHSGRTGRNEGESYDSTGNSGRSGRGNNEETSYGSSGRNEQSSSNTYGGSSGRNNNDEQSSYGNSGRTNQESSYESSSNTYGNSGCNEQSSENTYGNSGRSGRQEQESSYESSSNTYGGSGRSGRQEEESSGNNYGSSGRSGRQEEENSYGNSSSRSGNEESSYASSGRNEQESSYGNSGRNEQESSYGSSGRQNTSNSNSGYGGGRDNEEESRGSGYGRRGGDEDESEQRGSVGYGSGNRRSGREDESSGY